MLARYEVDGQYNISDDIAYLADADSDSIFEFPRCEELGKTIPETGSKCIASDLVSHKSQSVFERVKIDESHSGWKDPEENIWSDSLGLTGSPVEAQKLCNEIGGTLPTGREYYTANYRHDLPKAFSDLNGEKTLAWTADTQDGKAQVFFNSSLFGSTSLEAVRGSKYAIHCLIQEDTINAALRAKTLAIVSKSDTLTYVISNRLSEPKPNANIPVSSLDLNSVRCDHGQDGERAYSYCVIPVQNSSRCKLQTRAVEFDFDSQGQFKFVIQPETNCVRF